MNERYNYSMYDVEEYVEFLLELALDAKTNEETQKLIEISKKMLEMSVKLNNNVVSVNWKNPQMSDILQKQPIYYEPNRTNTTPFVINPYLTCTSCESDVATFSTTTTNNNKKE